ncbi:MAG TPA: hypothetical protein VD791_10965 [Burkholderiales bacterium]|nr:hypothetical protein [Burkholderiales bacterium]
MDRTLGREFEAIARDSVSGAADLTLRAAAALDAWLRRREPSAMDVLLAARRACEAQPSMAPMLRLANDLAAAAESPRRLGDAQRALRGVTRTLRRAPQSIARHMSVLLRAPVKWQVVTYSASSTVLAALRRARRRIGSVFCSEGRPRFEGRALAVQLARARIPVVMATDAALLTEPPLGPGTAVVLGADAVLTGYFINKVGTSLLVDRAVAAGAPVFVLADTMKFWPESPFRSTVWRWTYGHPHEVWTGAPRLVRSANPTFDATRLRPGIHVVTEHGPWTTPRVRRHLERLRISRNLLAALD